MRTAPSIERNARRRGFLFVPYSQKDRLVATDNTDATTQADEATEAQAADTATHDESQDVDESQADAISLAEAKKLRSENRNLRERLKAEEEAKQESEKARQAAEEAKLAENEEYKTLADKRAERLLELEPLEPKVKDLESDRDRYRDALQSHVDAMTGELPDNVKELLADREPIAALEWLSKHAAAYKTKGASGVPDTPSPNGDTKMSDEERSKLAALPGRDY